MEKMSLLHHGNDADKKNQQFPSYHDYRRKNPL